MHRSATPKANREGTFVAQTIIKFSNWNIRKACQGANRVAREKKVGTRIHHDLTKRRFKLLSIARSKIQLKQASIYGDQLDKISDDQRVFAYVDVNSNMKVRADKQVFSFNTENEFDAAFKEIYHQE